MEISPVQRKFLLWWIAWGLFQLAALTLAILFFQGVVREERWGNPKLVIFSATLLELGAATLAALMAFKRGSKIPLILSALLLLILAVTLS